MQYTIQQSSGTLLHIFMIIQGRKLLDVDVQWSWWDCLLLLFVHAVVLLGLIMVPLLVFPTGGKHNNQSFPYQGDPPPPHTHTPAKNLLIHLTPPPPIQKNPPVDSPLTLPQNSLPTSYHYLEKNPNKNFIFSFSHCSCSIFLLILYTQVKLFFILINAQYFQKSVCSFAKGLNGQNYSSSGPQHPIIKTQAKFTIPPPFNIIQKILLLLSPVSLIHQSPNFLLLYNRNTPANIDV